MASRKDEKERLRQERIERESADRERKAKQAKARKLAAVVGVVALIAAVVAGVVLAGGSKDDTGPKDGWPNGPTPTEAIKFTDPSEETLASVAKQAKCTVRETPNEGRTHKPDDFKFKYRQSPPTSGNHTVEWADDGAYKKAPPTPKLVHALEHGRVIFWWNPKKVSQANIGTIKKL
ncbi:MAG TPA: DUF3105 domain-containing protein, partial [Solirubrobacterales bacterium]|nr:DUF3105 domain-containing protein [Solirubrobacterales bacterium]